MRNAALPVTLIVLGLIGLVWYFRWVPDMEYVAALGLIAGGVLVLAMDRITKSSIVLGPTLIGLGLAWLAHEHYGWRWSLLVPVLLIVIGGLMLVARDPRIPDRPGGKAPQ
jgi:MFS family permease